MEVVSIPIEKIHISPLNVRAGVEFGDEEDMELRKNVDSLGLIQPIVVRPVGDEYEIVIGSRRYQSLKEAGAAEIPCVVRELSDDESLDLSLSENIFKKDVDPITLGRWLKERLSRGDLSLSAYARKIGKSKSTVSEWLRMNDLPEELKRYVAEGAIPFRQALKIARMELSGRDRGMLLEEMEDGGIEALTAALDRIAAGREKRGAPKGLQVVRINFGKESHVYQALVRQAEERGTDVSDYCMNILSEHVRRSNLQ